VSRRRDGAARDPHHLLRGTNLEARQSALLAQCSHSASGSSSTAVTTSPPQVTTPSWTMEGRGEIARQDQVAGLREARDLRRHEQRRLVRDRP
jgi:hypothetical protein